MKMDNLSWTYSKNNIYKKKIDTLIGNKIVKMLCYTVTVITVITVIWHDSCKCWTLYGS